MNYDILERWNNKFTDFIAIICSIRAFNHCGDGVRKKASALLHWLVVVWAGVEPATHGFSVHCSTN